MRVQQLATYGLTLCLVLTVAAVPLWTTPGALQATAAVQQTEPVQVSAVESRALRGLLSKPFKRAGLSNSLSQLLKASSATVQIAAADRSYKRNGKERRHSKDKRISGHRSKYFEGLSQSPSYTAPQQHHHTSAAQEAYQETMKRREPYDSTGRQPRPQQAPVQSQRPSAQPVRDEPRPQHDEQQEEPATSIGEIFRFSSAVDINYYGGATDTGHVDGSLAGSQLFWSLNAGNPFNSTSDEVMPDGEHGWWMLSVTQGTPILPVPSKPYITLHGPAAQPARVTITGRLNAIWRDAGQQAAYTAVIEDGQPPEGFLQQQHVDVTPSECRYINPCQQELLGTATLSPPLGRSSLRGLRDRNWIADTTVMVICNIEPGQRARCE